MPEDKLKKLHSSVSAEYDLPDYDTFKSDMGNEDNLKRLYDSVSESYDLPEFSQFKTDMGLGGDSVGKLRRLLAKWLRHLAEELHPSK